MVKGLRAVKYRYFNNICTSIIHVTGAYSQKTDLRFSMNTVSRRDFLNRVGNLLLLKEQKKNYVATNAAVHCRFEANFRPVPVTLSKLFMNIDTTYTSVYSNCT